MPITKIVLTGGPCAGKTTALNRIQGYFSKAPRNYKVVIVPETATELITGGITPEHCRSNLDYQRCQMQLQLEKERIFEQGAACLDFDKILLVYDRGAMDNKAYMDEETFRTILKESSISETELRDHYDAVFHLVTAAKGAVEYYTRANNEARSEQLSEAAALDDRTLDAWTGHPHFRVIDNSTDFEDKLQRLLSEIAGFLGEPEPYEIERKYLIRRPDPHWLETLPSCRKVDIIQTYLNASGSNEEIRVRQRGENGSYLYYQTIKRRVNNIERIEIEKRLSQEEYLVLLMEADTSLHPVRKNRYCLTFQAQYFEIDIYPGTDDLAIMEIELNRVDQKITFPDGIEVIREVTDDEAYKNRTIAKNGFPHVTGQDVR